MSPNTPPLNPSQTVERIREIIVGRHLERLEQRVAKLETFPTLPAAAPIEPPARDEVPANLEQLLATTREETQRLAQQIQMVAAQRMSEAAPAAAHQLERKLSSWLTDWQASFQVHLHDRDRRLAEQLRTEVASLWENTEAQLTRLESRTMNCDAFEERFHRIATAARALAESVSPGPSAH
jgi:chromosome segregation ATPase